jgi:twitching motility protein PilT
MARIDSLLSIVAAQGANELRLGSDREPKMLAHGAAKKLAIPAMSGDTLRDLLGEILTPEREEAMRARGRIEVSHDAGALGTFQVTLASRDGGAFDAIFLRGARREPVVHAAPVAPAPVIEPRAAPVSTSTVETVASAFSDLVGRATALRASDLHLADGEAPSVRVDGRLQRLDVDAHVDVASLMALDATDRDRIARGAALDLAREIDGVGRVRAHVFRTADGLAAAVRLLPRAAPSLASLLMPVPLGDLVDLPNGLVLVCGATGSGKSTTLAALAQEALRKRSIVLTTLEDPIEYALTAPETSIVRRRQVGRDVRDFASGLRDALREDPDILLVGELRDPETIALALTAAETGQLVLASMHSRSAGSAVERIVDAMPEGRQAHVRVQLAESLRAVIAQQLLPRARGSGRIPAVEVLRVTHGVASLIREGKASQIATALQSGRRDGMIALERCLADRVLAGEVTVEDARAVANDPSSLAMYLAK